jgi:hypothetical protein
LLHLRHELPDTLHGLDSVGSGQLVDGNDGAGLAIEATDYAVVLRAQFDSGYVFNSNGSTVCRFAYDNVAELFWRRQPTLGQYGIGELLILLSWLSPDLASRIHSVLGVERVNNVRNCYAQLR